MKPRHLLVITLTFTSILFGGSFATSNFLNPEVADRIISESYDKAWLTVDSLEDKGLPKSALDLTELILEKAKLEIRADQQIKALIYIAKYIYQLEEKGQIAAIRRIESETYNSSFPVRPLLLSIQADLYQNYLSNELWRILERTEVINQEEELETWDARKISNHISSLHLKALQYADELKPIAIDDFEAILIENKESRKLRPTLYDFVAHRAFDHFSRKDSWEVSQQGDFFINDPIAFESAAIFSRHNFSYKDTSDNSFRALKLLQSLTAFHLDDETPYALADLEINRLNFVKDNFTGIEKEDSYYNALLKLESVYKHHEAGTDITYELAKYHRELAEKYQVGVSNTYRWENKKAIEFCNSAISRFKDSYGAQRCKALKSEIESKYFRVEMEKVNVPDKPFISKIAYTNIDKIYIRVVKWSEEEQNKHNKLRYDEKMPFLVGLKPYRTWSQALPDDGGHNRNSTEIRMTPLEQGSYLILTSADESFSVDHNGLAISFTSISNLAFFYRQEDKSAIMVTVTDRSSGKPLKGANVTVLENKYNFLSRTYHFNEIGNFKTNDLGMISLPPKKEYRDLKLKVTYKSDVLENIGYMYQSAFYKENESEINTNTYFFTDRKIYRPGQIVYFKGLMIAGNNDKYKVLSGQETTTTFYDVNNQVISQQTFRTNEYGSFSGTFIIPGGILTGNMRIENGTGSISFSVEEYKRPRFYVESNPVASSYSLGDSVTITGKALAYAGSNIDQATVSYQVKRSASFPWHKGWFYWIPQPQPKVITFGKTVTDELGNYSITFLAEPDQSIDPKTNPLFHYSISIDVVDMTGETRSSSATVKAGYVALELNIKIPEEVSTERDTFQIAATNLSGEKQATRGQIRIWQLAPPQGVIKPRLWTKPDTFVMPANEFKKLFPNDGFGDEHDYTSWDKGNLVYDKPFNTGISEQIILDMHSWNQGKYMLEIGTIDKNNTAVEVVKYFTLNKPSEKQIPLPDIFVVREIKATGQPGEKAVFEIGTATPGLFVLCETEHKDIFTQRHWIYLNNEKKTIEFPIIEDHRGNFNVHFTYVWEGRYESVIRLIMVPWTNKKLTLEFETFRDKIEPGKNETWKIKIKGPEADFMASEMLATMYDMSLDDFKANKWYFNLYPERYKSWRNWEHGELFGVEYSRLNAPSWNTIFHHPMRLYEQLNWFGYNPYPMYFSRGALAGVAFDREVGSEMKLSEVIVVEDSFGNDMGEYKPDDEVKDKKPASPSQLENKTAESAPAFRTNLNETAFFFPDLETDEEGNIIISFTSPESLTKWKFMAFAHNKNLAFGFLEDETVTQKELMVMPNAPRFLRENDTVFFTSKVINLSDKDLSGTTSLQLFDAITMKPLDTSMILGQQSISFSAPAGQSYGANWQLFIPKGLQAIVYRVSAKSENFTDGEEASLPVLSNRMLVTEALPFYTKGNLTRTFSLDKLLNNKSTTLTHHKLTLELTSNPTWYAIQALPYMMEYPYECSEQLFSRFYANSIASHIVNSQPRIKQVFEQWKTSDALISNLEKNQELKSLLLQETPWVLEAGNEQEQKKRVALLFDINKMSGELQNAITKLSRNQASNGGWPWFKGMPDNRYITQHIISGFGHLKQLHIGNNLFDDRQQPMIDKALHYLDDRMKEDYDNLQSRKIPLDQDNLGSQTIQYLYARSFYSETPISIKHKEAFGYWKKQAATYWVSKGIYMQGMISLALNRYGNQVVGFDIIKSLKERSLSNEELGMYWKSNAGGYYWHEAPIETQALLIEAFAEVANDLKSVEEMKIWLLKNKQTNHWATTKSTTEACYALLMQGDNWLADTDIPKITVGSSIIDPSTNPDISVEAGTGYLKTSWISSEISNDMGKIKVAGKEKGISWGSLYWQYFEDLEKITPHNTPLKIKKELYKVIKSKDGEKLELVGKNSYLTPGDLIHVRIILKVDRDMEFVHMKDMRASGFEPVNVLSGYKYQDGLGYYESTGDAATNFFFSWLPKGTYVFEYPVRVFHEGDFSNGITSIQCMYAPEFTAHSQGIRVRVR